MSESSSQNSSSKDEKSDFFSLIKNFKSTEEIRDDNNPENEDKDKENKENKNKTVEKKIKVRRPRLVYDPILCVFCNFEYRRATGYKEHILKLHLKDGAIYKCHFCKHRAIFFASREQLMAHFLDEHDLRLQFFKDYLKPLANESKADFLHRKSDFKYTTSVRKMLNFEFFYKNIPGVVNPFTEKTEGFCTTCFTYPEDVRKGKHRCNEHKKLVYQQCIWGCPNPTFVNSNFWYDARNLYEHAIECPFMPQPVFQEKNPQLTTLKKYYAKLRKKHDKAKANEKNKKNKKDKENKKE